ncbi:hypothetical protein FRC17_002818 [Serendipita sp. 399]|nr:hypothetical protein FRC17_002818 [Serendipita sp. 399]
MRQPWKCAPTFFLVGVLRPTNALPTKMASITKIIDTANLLRPLQHAVGILSNFQGDSTPPDTDENTTPLVVEEGQFELSDLLNQLLDPPLGANDQGVTPPSSVGSSSSLDSVRAHMTVSGVIPHPSGLNMNVNPEGRVVSTYYPDWAASELPPENIDFKRFNWVDFGEYFRTARLARPRRTTNT